MVVLCAVLGIHNVLDVITDKPAFSERYVFTGNCNDYKSAEVSNMKRKDVSWVNVCELSLSVERMMYSNGVRVDQYFSILISLAVTGHFNEQQMNASPPNTQRKIHNGDYKQEGSAAPADDADKLSTKICRRSMLLKIVAEVR